MSYDIIFVRVGVSADPLAAARELAQRDFDEEGEPSPSQESDERSEAVVRDLLKLHPSLRYLPADDGGAGGYVDSDNDTCPIPLIELGTDTANVSISYSADPSALESILPVVKVFAGHGYVAYDPQTDSLIDPGQFVSAAKAVFRDVNAAFRNEIQTRGEILIHPAPKQRKRWWEFWK